MVGYKFSRGGNSRLNTRIVNESKCVLCVPGMRAQSLESAEMLFNESLQEVFESSCYFLVAVECGFIPEVGVFTDESALCVERDVVGKLPGNGPT